MLEFKKIEIDDFENYHRLMGKSQEFSCENAFVNLLVWQKVYNNMLCIFDDKVFVKSGTADDEIFSLPIGSCDLKENIEILKEYLGGKMPKIWAQEGPNFTQFKEFFGDEYTFLEDKDYYDYIYLQSDLANLSGKKYHSKRNHISAFSKKYDWHYEKIGNDNIEKVKLCFEKWYSENAERMDELMLCEKQGIETVLDNMELLDVSGGAIVVEDNVVAFSLGSAINNRVYDVHFEKALSEYQGAYATINREFAKNELSDYEFINREDDMGIEGLRKAKLSYKPVRLIKKYICIPREN